MDVYVASKNMRGSWADRSHLDNPFIVDVTSAQAKQGPYRKAFSPMHMGDPYVCEHEGSFPNFEAYWQSLKMIEGQDEAKHKKWWKDIKAPKRRHPSLSGIKKSRVVGAKHKRFPGEVMNYVESRKKVYVPDYYKMVMNKYEAEHLQLLQQHSSRPIVVYDFDGPRNLKGEPICEKVTVEMLRERINDASKPFGHGFVVAAMVAGIEPAQYTA